MTKRYSLEMVVVVALFAVYAMCAVMLCTIGADIYRNTADSMRQNYDDRTSALYVIEKVRQNDQADSIDVGSVSGSDALVLTERESGNGYKVWLFVKDGALYEGLFEADAVPEVALCQKIMPMESMEVSANPADDSQLNITFVTVDGHSMSIDLTSRATSIGGV